MSLRTLMVSGLLALAACGAGRDGAAGADGTPTLVSASAEPPGAHCAAGGTRLAAGADANGNGILDPSEVATTSYACNGAPAAELTWVDVTAATAQALPNTGYVAHADAGEVAITLPPAPAVGDLLRVSGLGQGGWRIVQNDGQAIELHGLGIPGAVWAPSESLRAWRAVASSSDGLRLVAADQGGLLYTSANAGASWSSAGPAAQWSSVASSADGQALLAAVAAGPLYLSTDGGATWNASTAAGVGDWASVASSASGRLLLAARYGDRLQVSRDAGQSWSAVESARLWTAVASSADGAHLVAVGNGERIYVSTDGGATWGAQEQARNWTAVASSADGLTLLAAESTGPLHLSTDGGTVWTPVSASRSFTGTAVSADGAVLVATATGGQVHVSTDGGATWRARASTGFWTGLACSADCSRILAVSGGKPLFTSAPFTTTGASGGLSGRAYEAVTLQYQGSGRFAVLSHEGALDAR